MPNPKRKHTRSRRDKRRSENWKLSMPGTATCKNCQAVIRANTICQECGTYKGKVEKAPKVKTDKKEENQEQK